MDDAGIAVMQERRALLIVCPSSNHFLFRKFPSSKSIHEIENTSLGSDSPITGIGDLLDEIRFTIEHCGIAPEKAYRMVTEAPAKSLRLHDGEGNIYEGGVADLIAVRDTGESAAARLRGLSMAEIELVLLGGQVQLASDHVFGLLPPHVKQDMECLWINGILRWLRTPVSLLLREAEAVVGRDNAYLGGKPMRSSQL
jgi:cytosine/adenosine deaminase-related metal-dependent hydrolase